LEARCLFPFAATAEAVAFPFVAQAARLIRCFDSVKRPAAQIDTEYRLCSRPGTALAARSMLEAERGWGIEIGLHLRLDVSAGEDRRRMRHRTSALNLAMMRRAVVRGAIHWIRQCRNPRKATLRGFFDTMSAQQSPMAFSLVTARRSSALQVS